MGATLLSRNSLGLSEYVISKEEDLKSINVSNISPASKAILLKDNQEITYMLKGDKSGWQKINNSSNDNSNNDFLEEIKIVNGLLKLTDSKYQKCDMQNNTEIILPIANDFKELHLFFKADMDYTLILPSCKWQGIPTINSDKTYEFIFININNEWLGRCIVYE